MKKPQLQALEHPLWASTGHAQTIMGHLLPSPSLADQGERVEIVLPDSERLLARFYTGSSGLLVYLFHGLGGSIGADYMHRSARLCLEMGHSVLLVNHRGCGEGEGLALQPYHSGRGEDLSAVFEWGRKKFPGKKHLGIGFSLSGNALLCLISGLRGSVLPDYAISVNAPIDLKSAATILQSGLNRIYDLRFVNGIRKVILKRQSEGLVDPTLRFPRLMTLQNIDELYTAPVSGFGSAENYYAACSTKNHLAKIKIPTILLTAEDDPFVDVASYKQAALSETTHLHIEKKGGHMGYLSKNKTPLGTKRWLDYALKEFVQALV